MVTTIRQFAESFPNTTAQALIKAMKEFGLTGEVIQINGEVGIAFSESVNGEPFATHKCPDIPPQR